MPEKIYEQTREGSFKLIDTPSNVNIFLEEYENLCKKYNLSLSHEDTNGGFIITEYKEGNINWVNDAILSR